MIKIKKGNTNWLVGIAWLDNTLYIGIIIYIALKFKKPEAA